MRTQRMYGPWWKVAPSAPHILHRTPSAFLSEDFVGEYWCRVRKGTGSQSVVICVGKYPGGESQQQVFWVLLKQLVMRAACGYWLSGVLCTPVLAKLRLCIYGYWGTAKLCLYSSLGWTTKQLHSLILPWKREETRRHVREDKTNPPPPRIDDTPQGAIGGECLGKTPH